jgi:DNA mismatch repair ATPase MutS
MKAFLLYPDTDLDLERPLPWNAAALTQDLGLETLFQAMAAGDPLLLEVARQVVLNGTSDVATIHYRQAILRDCVRYPEAIRRIHAIAQSAIERERKEYFGILNRYPGAILARGIKVVDAFLELLIALWTLAETYEDKVESAGLRRFFAMLRSELGPQFVAEVRAHLRRLRFRDGVLVSARLGKGLKGLDYVLRHTEEGRWRWLRRLLDRAREQAYTVYLHPRDETGARCLAELRDRGLNLVADALSQAADHILDFFTMLRGETAFYIGCLNLVEGLARRGRPTCFPVPSGPDERRLACTGLYDVALALRLEGEVVGNDVAADGKLLVIVTGANQGGKSTFLRSVGLGQLMMQAGMLVPAESFAADVCDSVLTHYKREEDASMRSGKLDEELGRMSGIVDHVTPSALLLFNESFAATNEREGSEIARQIVRALVEHGRKVVFVTHFYDLARSFHERRMASALFLRADRQPDGTRTFKLVEAPPLPTSFGEDLYARIFAAGEA